MLTYADYTKPFKVHTDASEHGLGAVLYQDQDDSTTRVIALASHILSNAETRYHSSKLEFLALKWSICDHFHEYLYGAHFEVFTDNNPLTYVLSTAKLDATGQRWVAILATYNFTIHYRSGKQNIEADALSHIERVLTNSVLLKAYLEGISVNDTMIPLSSELEEIHVNTLQIGSAPKMST